MQDKNKKTGNDAKNNGNGVAQQNPIEVTQTANDGEIEITEPSQEEASFEKIPETTKTEVELCKEEVERYKDKYVRLFAEFDNFKRRNAKERVELIQTAGKEVITSLLEVLDDCDRAEKQMNTSNDIEQIKSGVKHVFNKLRSTLQSKGLKAMESLNTDFDVEKHEAITNIEVPDKSKKGKVIDEITKGYYLNDKLIRFAKVVVAK
jgi:molecular chaperone GrpE